MWKSIKTSLVVTIVGIVALLVTIVALGLVDLLAIRSASSDLSDRWLPSVQTLCNIRDQVTQARFEPQPVSADRTRRIDDVIAAYENVNSGYAARSDWRSFKASWKDDTKNRPFADVLKNLAAETDSVARGADEAKALITHNYIHMLTLMLVFLAIAAVGGGVAIWYVLSGIATPLVGLAKATQAIAGGDLSAAIPSTDRRNEIGDMARSLIVFRDGLAEAARLRAHQDENDAALAERMKVERHTIADRFMATMGALAATFVKSSAEVASAANNLSGTAQETSRRASEVSSAAQSASGNVQMVAAATEQLSASVQEINRQVEHSSTIAAAAAQEAAGAEVNISELSSAATDIGDVVNLIRDIAGKTNLLALNATIESARAGEAGRGFAVVASEVKGLASQTAKATDEIAIKISVIQSATNSSVEAIRSIVSTIGEIRDVSVSIAAAVEQQGHATQEISGNTFRAAESASQVTVTISGVGEAANNTGSAASQLRGLSLQLSEKADDLTKEVANFAGALRSA